MNVISLCLIVKNEAERLADCLESARAAVDEIIVVDTGSTDATMDVARECGAQVYTFPWCGDFSAARNESIRHATGDWILVLDADERLTPAGPGKLRELAASESYDIFLTQIRSPYCFSGTVEHISTVLAARLFRNRPDLRYKGKLHESIDPAAAHPEVSVAIGNIILEHLGYLEDVTVKYRRNYTITSPGDPGRTIDGFDLIRRDMALGQYHDALDRLDRELRDPSLAGWITAQLYLLLGDTLSILGRHQESLSAWQSSQEQDTRLVSPQLRLGVDRYQKQDYVNALASFEAIIGLLMTGALRGAILDDEIPLSEALSCAAACCLKLGKKEQGMDYIARSRQPCPEDTGAVTVSFDWRTMRLC